MESYIAMHRSQVVVYGKYRVTGIIPKGPFCTPARTKNLYAYTSGDTRRELDLHRASRHMLQARLLRWICWKHSRSKPRFRSRFWQVGKPKQCRDNPSKAFPPAFSKNRGCMDGWGTSRCPWPLAWSRCVKDNLWIAGV